MRLAAWVFALVMTVLSAPAQAGVANYQGLWWNPSQSGWGVNLAHQGDVLFATWFTYDTDTNGMWLVMSSGTKIAEGTYSGTLYRGTGPGFDASPWNPAQVSLTAVGSATFTFADVNNGSFSYTVGGVTQTKPITRQVFAAPQPACAWNAQPNLALAINYQDAWWNPSESGWVLNLTHQGDVIFATWFTYDASHRDMWLVMSNGAKTGPGAYSGSLFRANGPVFSATPWNPASVSVTAVGTMTLTFADGNNGTLSASVGGSVVTKPITRLLFVGGGTTCGFAPSSPTIGTATAGNTRATISFAPPSSNGGFPITNYTATCNPGGVSHSGAASPIEVDGLANGTPYNCSVTATNAAGASVASGTVSVKPMPPRTGEFIDFNADGKADIVWRNTADGSVLVWIMDGTAVTQQASIAGPGTTRQPQHIADFDGFGVADMIWQDADGSTWLSQFDGPAIDTDTMLVGAGTGWSVTHVGDFNGDGKADLVWTHTSGAMQVWLMDGSSAIGSATFVPGGTGWSVIKVADLNGDGKADIIWQHATGSVQAWLMDGLTVTQVGSFVGAGTGWTVALTADLDGDGKDDLVWTNTDGAVQAWGMNGLTVNSVWSWVPPGAGYTPTHGSDLNGDGRADVLWRYADGTVLAWIMGPAFGIQSIASFTGSGNQFEITHARDLNGDGKSDILWRHPDGTVQAWLMDGTTATSLAVLTGAGPYMIVPPMP